jgi:acyl-coenzyme A synthetase/AMP-(fatty) acid ligase
MTAFPLITHTTLDKIMAWQHGRPVTAAKFLADAAHLASMLPAGGHVLNICRDRYHFTVGLAAAILSNKVSLLPPTHTPEMVAQLKAFSADVFCLHDSKHCDIALPLMPYPPMPEHVPFEPPAVPQIDIQQTIAIVFTSGSTGVPVPHIKSWGSLVQNVRAQAARLELDPAIDYAIMGTVPPQHMYGFESTVLLPLQTANAMSSAQPFYPADILAALDDLPTSSLLVSTPLHLRLLLEAGLDIPQVALVLSATAPLSVQLAQAVESRFGAYLLEIYGSTETGQIATRRTTQTAEWQLFPGVRLTEKADRIWASHGHVETPIALNDVVEPLTASRFLPVSYKQLTLPTKLEV